MNKPHECKNMLEIRTEIDIIDSNIIELIAQRAGYVKCAAKFKKDEAAVRDEKRVAAVINSKKQLAEKHNVSPELIGSIYSTMIDFFVNEEIENWKLIKNTATQGAIDVEFIEKYLAEKNVYFEIISHSKPIKTKADAEKYFKIEETAPTLILSTEKGLFSLIVSGARSNVDFRNLKKQLKFKNISLMEKREVKAKFDLDIGAIPMVGLGLPTIMDNLLFGHEFVHGGCGNFWKTLKISPQDLVKVNDVVLRFD